MKVCAIVHSDRRPEAFLGVVGEFLAARAQLDVVVAGAPLPDPAALDAVVVMGSGRSAYDDTVPWLPAELDWLRSAAPVTSVLGICFGGQLLARALGGTVAPAPAPEIGWYPVATDAPELVGPGPWYEHHHDAFTVPPGAVELARTTIAPQAFRHGRHLGVQFHPEIDTAVYAAWDADTSIEARATMAARGVDRDRLAADIAAGEAANRPRALALLDAWWTTVRPPP